jgi:hypothetical protein
VIDSQSPVETAFAVQEPLRLAAVTVADAGPPDALGDAAAGAMFSVGVGVAPAIWFTVNVADVLPWATVMVPLRAGPVFACTA